MDELCNNNSRGLVWNEKNRHIICTKTYTIIPRSTSIFCFRTDASNDANLASSAFSFSKSPDSEDVVIIEDGSSSAFEEKSDVSVHLLQFLICILEHPVKP